MTQNVNKSEKNVNVLTNEQISVACKAIGQVRKESLNSLLSAFVETAKKNKLVSSMLDTLCEEKNAVKHATEKDWINKVLKNVVILAYPYRHKKQMLEKRDGIYQPIEIYTESIIDKAYKHKVGAIKAQQFDIATPEQVAEAKKQANEKREQTRLKTAETRAKKQNEIDMYKRFFEECMQAASATTLLEIRDKYKNESYQKDIIEKIDKANGK